MNRRSKQDLRLLGDVAHRPYNGAVQCVGALRAAPFTLTLIVMLLASFMPVYTQEGTTRCVDADWRVTWGEDQQVMVSLEPPFQPEPTDQPPMNSVDDLILFGLNIHSQPQLYAVDPAGENLYCVAVCPLGCRAPVWSEDGERVGFVTGEGLSIVTLDEGRRVDVPLDFGSYVHQHDSGQRLVDWSPDLSQAVFTARIDNSTQLFLVDTTTGTVAHLDYAPRGGFLPRFSPDAERIALTAGEQIYIVTPAVPDVRVVSGESTRFDSVVWSPDGDTLAFREIFGGTLRLNTMDSSGQNIRILHEGILDTPVWSPDGEKIALNLWADSSGTTIHLAVVTPEGEIITIAENAKTAYTPSWTADSAHVVYVGTLESDGRYDGLFMAEAAGENPPRLLIAPVSGPTDIATSPAAHP